MRDDDLENAPLPLQKTKIKPKEATKKALPKKTGAGADLSAYNSEAISLLMELSKLPPVDLLDPQQIKDRFYYYFDYCIAKGEKPTESALALSIGITVDTYHTWLRGGTIYNPEQQKVVQWSHQVLEALSEKYLLDGKGYPASMIFYLKNKFGYKDETTTTYQLKETYEDEDIEKIREQYSEERKAIKDDAIENGEE